MTNEEAIEVLEQDMFSVYCTDLKEAMGMAVNSLKAWEKIRAEIEKESEVKTLQLRWGEAMGLNKAIEIIDKYREVSE